MSERNGESSQKSSNECNECGGILENPPGYDHGGCICGCPICGRKDQHEHTIMTGDLPPLPAQAEALRRIGALFRSWRDGDEPEGAPSSRRTLLAIGEILAELSNG